MADQSSGGCVTFVEAIRCRYLDDDPDPTAGFKAHDDGFTFDVLWHDCRSLRVIVLNEQRICKAGDFGLLNGVHRSVTSLDLSGNELSDWQEVVTILDSMVALTQCNLSFNPLTLPWQPSCAFKPLLRLTELALNGTNVRWDALVMLLTACSNLGELHLSLNDFSKQPASASDAKDLAQPCFSTVRTLAIDQCGITSWERVAAVCRYFPCLRCLIAAGNQVDDFGSADSIEALFPLLETLNVNHWRITDWDALNVFRLFPSLRNLRVKNIPLFENLDDKQRIRLAVACLPSIAVLNGASVDADKREDCERFFIRHFLDDPVKPDRYHELVERHGHLRALPDIDLSPKLTAAVMVIFEDMNKKEARRVSLKQSVACFKKSLEEFCGLPSRRFRLFHSDIERVATFGIEELKLPEVMLHSLHVNDGDEFIIQVIPDRCRSQLLATGCGA